MIKAAVPQLQSVCMLGNKPRSEDLNTRHHQPFRGLTVQQPGRVKIKFQNPSWKQQTFESEFTVIILTTGCRQISHTGALNGHHTLK